ncbi:aspartate kinase [Ancylomarina sp. 16SWW S1-10-2]|uniref:aspartate kinase n=1 Tax=Ancylomarina sp. 16SWW S1-10-2 TaxID=2499681 RepID=UPI0012AD3C88|nr:aspartate kinase [Ancylomarina sp. 16SWW S1-10-2]MRT92744.1 aspartate kinase [Ancylomarina sp. 16SWW S1-10-2]
MLSISQIVEKIIAHQPFLAEALVEGLINVSSLARKIQPEVTQHFGSDVKDGAIVMSINRLIPKLKGKTDHLGAEVVVRDIIVRSQLVDYTYRNSSMLIERHTDLLRVMGSNQEYFYTMVQGVFESNLIVSQSLSEHVEDIFQEENLLSKSGKLSAVTLKLPYENAQQAGFYYHILKSIAWAGINIHEVISTTNEFTIVVSDDAIDKTFSVLKNLGQD